MKAVVTTAYGSEEVLKIQDVPDPSIGPDGILVKIHACSVNPIDWKIRKGDVKIVTGRKPPKILGGDYAGVVQEVGSAIADYRPGERVWGHINAVKGGAYAELIAVKAEDIGHMPASLSFEEAASVPLAGLTAYQALTKFGRLNSGHHVLVNGCSGGVGSMAVQFAKALGATVTGVVSTRNLDLAVKLGCDHVINYQTENVLAASAKYDIFFDAVGSEPFRLARKTLSVGGRYITTLPTPMLLFRSAVLNPFRSQKELSFLVKSSGSDLADIAKMVRSEKFVPIVDRVFDLENVKEAHRHSATGKAVGKIVLRVAP